MGHIMGGGYGAGHISEHILDPLWDHYGVGACHRAHVHLRLDLNRLVQDHSDCLLRSDFLPTATPWAHSRPEWRGLLFDFGGGVFVEVRLRINRHDDDPLDGTVTLNVYAPSPEEAGNCLTQIRDTYQEIDRSEPAGYLLLRADCMGINETKFVPVANDGCMRDEDLALHYGDDFVEWSADFIRTLHDKKLGMTILRGPPGTGKTFYLRHLVGKMHATHAFYFIPLDAYGWLSNPAFIKFWDKEQARRPDQAKIVILEDAETLLMPRDSDNRHAVSSLLNIADGLLGGYLHIHVICTVNCGQDQLDPAVLRPGRLLASREFQPLPFAAAQKLAAHLGITLIGPRDYTLAELFNPPTILTATAKASTNGHRLGFHQNGATWF